jgi:hypothetical protein
MLADDLDGNAGYVRHPVRCVGAVREGAFDEGKGSTRGLEQQQGAVDRSIFGSRVSRRAEKNHSEAAEQLYRKAVS